MINHLPTWLRHRGVWAALAATIALSAAMPGLASAAGDDFNIQVSPSPLVVTLTPGQTQTTNLTVRNFTNHPETLYPSLKGFTVDKFSKNVRLLNTAPADMQDWISFKQSSLVIGPGGSQQLTTIFNTPANVGFNYSFAVELSRSQTGTGVGDGIHLRGSVAVFCLVNINRPDAKKQFGITSLRSNKGHYSYLPADFTLTINNSGNVIDQPKGTLFIQRSFNSGKPIATLPINPDGNYILPSTSRDFTTSWKDGFPLYATNSNGKKQLHWDWKHLSQLRFGKYVAKAVIVYNDGHRDVPAIASTTFWVIPWMLIFALLIICIVLVMGIVGWGRLILRGTKKVRSYAAHRK